MIFQSFGKPTLPIGAPADVTFATTAAGTAYRSYTYIPTGGTTNATLLLPTPFRNGAVVLYFHGSGSTHTQVLALPTATRESWLDAGYAVASSAAVSEGWGNDAEIDEHVALAADLDRLWGLSGVLLLGRSMGGLAAQTIYANDLIDNIKGMIGNGAVCSLAAAHAADVNSQASKIETAYSFTGSENLAAAVAGNDPIELTASLFTGKRLRFYAAEDDSTIPKADHSDAQAARLTTATEADVVTVTGGHVGAASWQTTDTLAFFARCLA